MSASWYSTPARIAALDTAAESWLGTPFMANSTVPGPGGGVSCHNLVAELHFATGRLPRFDVPRRDPALLQHATPDLLLREVDTLLLPRGFTALDLPSTLGPRLSSFPPGSLLVIRFGRTLHHLVTMLSDGRIVHVTRLGGVAIEPLASLFANRKVPVSLAALRIP